jgi:hypothetical protein
VKRTILTLLFASALAFSATAGLTNKQIDGAKWQADLFAASVNGELAHGKLFDPNKLRSFFDSLVDGDAKDWGVQNSDKAEFRAAVVNEACAKCEYLRSVLKP